MTDEAKTTKTRTRKFPIRNFAKLLDEFLEQTQHDLSDDIGDLKEMVNRALLKAYKE